MLDTNNIRDELIKKSLNQADTIFVFSPKIDFYNNDGFRTEIVHFVFYKNKVSSRLHKFSIVAPWGVVHGHVSSWELEYIMNNISVEIEKLNQYKKDIRLYEPDIIISIAAQHTEILIAYKDGQNSYRIYNPIYKKNPCEIDALMSELFMISSNIYIGFSNPMKGSKLLGYGMP